MGCGASKKKKQRAQEEQAQLKTIVPEEPKVRDEAPPPRSPPKPRTPTPELQRHEEESDDTEPMHDEEDQVEIPLPSNEFRLKEFTGLGKPSEVLCEGSEVVLEDSWTTDCNGGPHWMTTWADNPQYHLHVDRPATATFTIESKECLIGIYVLKNNDYHRRRVTYSEEDDLSHFTNDSMAFNKAEVSVSLNPEDSPYIVCPVTSKPTDQVVKYKLTATSSIPLTLKRAVDWSKNRIQGKWEGKGRGGPHWHPTWYSNPQYAITVHKPTRVCLSITSPANFVALNVIKRPNIQVIRKCLICDEELALNHVAHSTYTYGQYSVELALDGPASYMIVPSLSEPDRSGEYTIDVKSDYSVEINEMESWEEAQFEGDWSGTSAGGGHWNATWADNPQFHLHVTEPTKAVISLISRGNFIGMYIMRNNDPDKKRLSYVEGDCMKVLDHEDYRHTQTVTPTIDLRPEDSPYVLVPATNEPDMPGRFKLTILSDNKIRAVRSENWKEQTLTGSWQWNTAGGNHVSKFWRKNPQYLISAQSNSFVHVKLISPGNFICAYLMKTGQKERMIAFDESQCIAKANEEFAGVFVEGAISSAAYHFVPTMAQVDQEGEYEMRFYSTRELQIRSL